jgi:hypothetical protein
MEKNEKAVPHVNKKKKKEVPFNRTGIPWHAVPTFLLGNSKAPGIFRDLTLREIRMYLAILKVAGDESELSIEIENGELYKWLRLDDSSLGETRDGLVKHRLIKATKVGKTAYRYQITNPEDHAVLKTGQRWFFGAGVVLDDDELPPTASSWGELPGQGASEAP